MATDIIPKGHPDSNDPDARHVDPENQPASQKEPGRRPGMSRWASIVAAALVVGMAGYVIWPRSSAPRREGFSVVATKSLDELRSDGEKGDVSTQFDLGKRYAAGEGVTRDPVEAVRWFRLAAGRGHADAQVKLGWA